MKKTAAALIAALGAFAACMPAYAADPSVEVYYYEDDNNGLYTVNDYKVAKTSDTLLVLMVNGDTVPSAAPTIQNGRTLVPVRVISENLGAKVDWDASTRTVKITQSGKTVTMTIDSKTVDINGSKTESDAAPQIINSYTYVPLRLIADALGAEVGYYNFDADLPVYEGVSVAEVWVNKTSEPIKISEAEAVKMAEELFFSKCIKPSQDYIKENHRLSFTGDITPGNYNSVMPSYTTYMPKVTADFGRYYYVTLLEGDSLPRDFGVLVDKYDGSMYVSGHAGIGPVLIILSSTQEKPFSNWVWSIYQ